MSNGKGGTYTNNCDGTVTDSTTGLMWEKKTGTTGVYRTCASAADCPSPHDVGNGYTWSQGSSGIEGLAASLFLAQLNCAGAFATGCTPFAGHSDWRLPTITELAGGTTSPSTGGIIDASQVGTAKINPIFGPTNTASPYWSSSPSAVTGTAWYAVFGNRAVASNFTATNDYLVRAVRGGGA